MEEDLKILEDMIAKFKTLPKNVYSKEDLWAMCKYKHYKAIENLIARNKELEEEVNFLKKYSYIPFKKEKTESYGELITIEEKTFLDKRECIPKSKIKEKIEELEKEIKYFQKMDFISETAKRIQQREVLQELLED